MITLLTCIGVWAIVLINAVSILFVLRVGKEPITTSTRCESCGASPPFLKDGLCSGCDRELYGAQQ